MGRDEDNDKDEPPGGAESWQDIANISQAAENDPEGFEAYLETIDEANAEAYEAGEGEV